MRVTFLWRTGVRFPGVMKRNARVKINTLPSPVIFENSVRFFFFICPPTNSVIFRFLLFEPSVHKRSTTRRRRLHIRSLPVWNFFRPNSCYSIRIVISYLVFLDSLRFVRKRGWYSFFFFPSVEIILFNSPHVGYTIPLKGHLSRHLL